jgi:aspartyl-tRNA synthetase
MRTHTLDQVQGLPDKTAVKLAGAIAGMHEGGFTLRDAYGEARVEAASPEAKQALERFTREDVVQVEGEVTGGDSKAVRATSALRLTNAGAVPFVTSDDSVSAEDRMRHRALDLRRPQMQQALRARFQLAQALRTQLAERGFLDIETPHLGRWTPEQAATGQPAQGPPGLVFGLPEGPRLYQSLLAAGGFDQVYEIGSTFRRQDRYDRDEQPDFRTLSLCEAYAGREDLEATAEALLGAAMAALTESSLETPLPRFTWDQALTRFGSDRPDLRIQTELIDLSEVTGLTASDPYTIASDVDGRVFGLAFHDAGDKLNERTLNLLMPRRPDETAVTLWVRVNEKGSLEGPAAESLNSHVAGAVKAKLKLKPGSIAILSGGPESVETARVLGRVRARLGLRLLDPNAKGSFAACIVTELPYSEYDPERGRWKMRSGLTRARDEDLGYVVHNLDPWRIRGQSFRLVLNGWAIGSGEVLNHDAENLEQTLLLLGYPEADMTEDGPFGPILDALRAGMPPHGALRIGLERLTACLLGRSDVRDVIAFPKDFAGKDVLFEAPSPIEERDLRMRLEPILSAL